MESTDTRMGSGTTYRWRRMAAVLAILVIAGASTAPALHAQDATDSQETPDVVIPGTGDEAEDSAGEAVATEEETTEEAVEPATEDNEPAEEPEPSTGANVEVAATDTGHPAVMAHGLAFLTGDQAVWQVREVEPDPSPGSTEEVSNAAIVYQVTGSSVIRNDLTGKRALLSPGEVFFKSGGDPYTTFADSDDSVIWIFEVVGSDLVAGDAFYESPLIDDFDQGVFDFQIIRYVLEPGDVATLPAHTGTALVLSTDGNIDIEADGLSLLGTGNGQLVTLDATVANNSSDAVTFMMLAFGSEVGDTAASPGDDDSDSGDATSDEVDTSTTETATTESTVDDAADNSSDAGSSSLRTSINITAEAELYVVIVADGVTAFDGPIPVGGQSGEIVGSTFEVYTTVGVGTLFTNACGDQYYMGYEEGEAQYTLTANASSCEA